MFLAEGTIVDDKYQVISSIGLGGMGVVYEAKQIGLDRLVALKLISYMPSDKEELARFEREALVLSKLQHINIVQFYAYGVWQSFPYIIMERISGVSLQKKLSNNEQIPTDQIIDYAIQICDGLEHAHSNFVFHRDVKPSNIIISTAADGKQVVKLIDFGLAKLVGFSVQKLTQTNTAVGSVMYMSPEQCSAKKVDARSDIYSVGCLLYQCFAGGPPFSADNAVAVMFLQTNEPVEKCPGWTALPEAVQSIIARCMSKDPAQRYPSCSAVRDDLIQLSRMELTLEAPPVVLSTSASTVGTMPSPRIYMNNSLGLAMALCAICLAAIYYFTTRNDTMSGANIKTGSIISIETPRETLIRATHINNGIIDAKTAQQLKSALHHCSQDTTMDPDVLLEGYVRLLHYYKQTGDYDMLRAAARVALDNCRRTKNGPKYAVLLILAHQLCEQVGCELSLVKDLEETLAQFPTMPKFLKGNLSYLLARDYLRLGRNSEAKPILNELKGENAEQWEDIAKLRQTYQRQQVSLPR